MILIISIQKKIVQKCKCMFKYFSSASDVVDDGEEDKSDDEGQEEVADTQNTKIVNEMEDSQSSASASSNRVTTPLPLTLGRRPTPGKRKHYGPNKRDAIEGKQLEIIKKPEKQPNKDEIFCLSLATSLRKIQDPQKKEYTKLLFAAKNVQLHVWFMVQCRSNSTSNKLLCLCPTINKTKITV